MYQLQCQVPGIWWQISRYSPCHSSRESNIKWQKNDQIFGILNNEVRRGLWWKELGRPTVQSVSAAVKSSAWEAPASGRILGKMRVGLVVLRERISLSYWATSRDRHQRLHCGQGCIRLQQRCICVHICTDIVPDNSPKDFLVRFRATSLVLLELLLHGVIFQA